MKIIVSAFIALIMLSCSARLMRAQDPHWSHQIEAEAGLQIPGKGFNSDAPIGLGGVLTYYYRPALKFFISLSAGYHVFSKTSTDAFGANLTENISFIPLCLGAKYNFTTKGIQPYIGAELGAAISSDKVTDGTNTLSSDSTKLVVIPKIGVRVPLEEGLDLDFNLKYNLVFFDPSISYVGLNVGLAYTLDRLKK